LLTINDLPGAMNGSLPWLAADPDDTAFRLRVNRAYFTLDAIADDPEAGPADWASLKIVCDAALTTPSGQDVPAGEVLPPSEFEATELGVRLVFGADNPAPATTLTCGATLTGPGGEADSAIEFEAADLPAWLDPFTETDVWLITTSRDQFDVSVGQDEDGALALQSVYTPGGNGVPDFDEGFRAAGLMWADAPEIDAWVRERLLETIRLESYRIYGLSETGALIDDSVPIQLVFEGDPDAPDPADFDTGAFSMIALGGDGEPDDQGQGTLGRAKTDWNNQHREDNTVYGLGVFSIAAVRAVVNRPEALPLISLFLPGMGDPFGSLPSDAAIIAPGFDPDETDDPVTAQRGALIALIIKLGGRALAAVLCHEIGHSLGLVPFGAPPKGLFAEVETDFTTPVPDAHVNTEGLNVMQTGAVTNLLEAAAAVPDFNPLNRAYLTRRLVVGAP